MISHSSQAQEWVAHPSEHPCLPWLVLPGAVGASSPELQHASKQGGLSTNKHSNLKTQAIRKSVAQDENTVTHSKYKVTCFFPFLMVLIVRVSMQLHCEIHLKYQREIVHQTKINSSTHPTPYRQTKGSPFLSYIHFTILWLGSSSTSWKSSMHLIPLKIQIEKLDFILFYFLKPKQKKQLYTYK